MTTQKIEFEYVARNEQASSRAWQQGQSAIDGYNRELTETNARTRQAAEAMSAFGNKGRDAFAGMTERQRQLAQGLERLRQINQQNERDAWRQQQAENSSRVARMQAMYDADAHRHATGWASSALAARRNAAKLEFEDTVLSHSDLANLGTGERERRLTTGSRYRRFTDGAMPSRRHIDAIGQTGMILGLPTSGVGAGLATAAVLHKVDQQEQQRREQANRAADSIDGLSRKLQLQGSLVGSEFRAAPDRVLDIAKDKAMTKEMALDVSTQLVSSGFSSKEATNEALREMLTGINAMPAAGGQQIDPVALSEAATSYLTSQNMEKTHQNLRLVLGSLQRLFKVSNIQLPDFSELASQADALRGKLSVAEQLASFSVLRDVGKTGEESTTALRNLAIRGATAFASPNKVEALKTVGLAPQDIDMEGESFNDVLDRFAAAFEGKTSSQQTAVLKEVFDERAVSAIERLITDRQNVKERTSEFGDLSDYDRDAKLMESSPEAQKRRQLLRTERWEANRAQHEDILLSELSQNAKEEGAPAIQTWLQEVAFNKMLNFGFERDEAAGLAFGNDNLQKSKQALGDSIRRDTVTGGRIGIPGLIDPTHQEKLDMLTLDNESFKSDAWSAPTRNSEKRLPKTREEALEIQPNYDQLPRPGAKTSAPAVAEVGPVEMANSTLERGTQQQVALASQQIALLSQIADGIAVLSDRVGRDAGGRSEPRRATPPWDPRRPPPVGPVMSLSASEVG